MGSGSTEGKHKLLSPPSKLAPERLKQEEPIISRKGALQISQCGLPGCGESILPWWKLLIPTFTLIQWLRAQREEMWRDRNVQHWGSRGIVLLQPVCSSFHMARAVLSPTGGGTLFHVLNAPLLTAISSGPFKNGSHYFGTSLAPAHCQEPKVLTKGGNKIFMDSWGNAG